MKRNSFGISGESGLHQTALANLACYSECHSPGCHCALAYINRCGSASICSSECLNGVYAHVDGPVDGVVDYSMRSGDAAWFVLEDSVVAGIVSDYLDSGGVSWRSV